MKQTMALIMSEGLFTERPTFSGVEDIISYLLTRESYLRAEDADGDEVKRYAIICKIEIEEINQVA